MDGNLVRFAFIVWLASSLWGCAVSPRYQSRVVEAQKDVLYVVVSVPERLAPAAYRDLADKEVQKILLARRESSVPVYEVRFEFLGPRNEDGREVKYATFSWQNSASARFYELSSEPSPGDLASSDKRANLDRK